MSHAIAMRPRRKLLTPLTGTLTAVIVAAGGFIGGVQVQKHQATSSSSSSSGAPSGFPGASGSGAGPGATGGPGGATTSDATTGTVTSIKGDVLYVKDSDGNTVKVQVTSTADVTRTASSEAGKVHPGDSVVVQGKSLSSGTVKATTVVATQASS